MAKASTSNYDSAVEKYNQLAQQYLGAEGLEQNYQKASEIASKNSQKVQQDKYNTYISQGMNPAKAARMASQDASNQYTQDKNDLVNNLYSANKDLVNSQDSSIQNAKAKDDTSNQNKGRILSTVGGAVSGVASAISDERTKNIEGSSEQRKHQDDVKYYIDLLK